MNKERRSRIEVACNELENTIQSAIDYPNEAQQ